MQDEAAMSFRLSPQQELLWSNNPNGPVGGPHVAIGIAGNVEPARLRDGLLRVVERHEILRTTFPRRSGMHVPLQVVHESLAPAFDEVDLTALSAVEQDARVAELEQAARSRVWDYESGPLVHAQLAALGPDRHVLVLAVAAPCADAGSLSTATSELAAQYAGGPVADDPLQYADFAEWQHQLLAS